MTNGQGSVGRRSLQWALTAALVWMAPAAILADARTKTDVVWMDNGDKITCELKSLVKGQLSVKPDYTSVSIVLDWAKVARIESSQPFIVMDPQGNMYYGSLNGDAKEHTLTIPEAGGETLKREDVVQIAELGTTFVKKMRGNISVGTGFAQSNSQATLSVQSSVTYQSEKYYDTINWNSQFASQQKTSNTSETTVKTSVFRQLRQSNWYGGGIGNFLSSSEQQISLQSTLGAAVARRLIFTNKTNLTGIAGVGYTVQRNSPGSVDTNPTHTADGAFAVQFSTFRFDSTNFDTVFWVYPGLTNPGHVRTTLNQSVYYKFPGNLYISLSFFDNFDNQPVAGAPRNNVGASTQVGWSFP
jgi:hypothetical protein